MIITQEETGENLAAELAGESENLMYKKLYFYILL